MVKLLLILNNFREHTGQRSLKIKEKSIIVKNWWARPNHGENFQHIPILWYMFLHVLNFWSNCGANSTYCHNFGLQMNFTRVWPCVSHLCDMFKFVPQNWKINHVQTLMSHELMIVQYLTIEQYLMIVAQYHVLCF